MITCIFIFISIEYFDICDKHVKILDIMTIIHYNDNMWKLEITPGDISYKGISISQERLSSHRGERGKQCLVARQEDEVVAAVGGGAYGIHIEFVDDGLRVTGPDLSVRDEPAGSYASAARLASQTEVGSVTWSLTQIDSVE